MASGRLDGIGTGGRPRCPRDQASRGLRAVPAAAVTAAEQAAAPLRDRLASLLPALRAFAIPMRTRFRGITVREGALIEGPAGWGEFSPFPEYGPRECARWLACALEAAAHGWPAAGPGPGPGERDRAGRRARSGRTTIVAALRLPHREGQGGRARPARRRRHRPGARPSGTPSGPDGRVRVDANGAWGVDHAARMLRRAAGSAWNTPSSPAPRLAELAELRRRVDVPLAADESIRRAEDPLGVRAAGAADIVVLKAQPLGGVRAGAADRRRLRPAGGGVQRGGHLGGPGGRRGAGRRAARACRTPAGWPR